MTRLPKRKDLFVGFLLSAILSSLVPVSTTDANAQAGHPMDALTFPEVTEAVRLVREAGLAGPSTLFPVITLKEMPKADVLTWSPGKPISRSAFVVMRDPGKTSQAIVDLDRKSVSSQRQLPGAQPSIMQSEWDRAGKLAKADKRWQQAMGKRGYKDFSTISCVPLSAGHFPSEGHGKRRIFKVTCYQIVKRTGRNHPDWARPIEGVIAVVDVDGDTIIDVIDVEPVIPADRIQSHGLGPIPTADLPKPVLVVSPQGQNYIVKDAVQVAWHDWSFHVRADRRAGLILSLIRFDDAGEKRLIAYQMALAEMFVPYMDPHPGWSFKSFLDAGEYGLGYLTSPLDPGRDCPQHAVYLNLTFPSDSGRMFKVDRAMCIFERNTADPAWRHYTTGADRVISRPKVELVVRYIPTLGNYDYVIDYVFDRSGQIRVRAGATGLDAVKTVAVENATAPGGKEASAHGAFVAPYLVAPYHDHYFSFRVDLDVDGQNNTLVREKFRVRKLPAGNIRKSLWDLERKTVTAEGPVIADSGGRGEIWRIINPSRRTLLGHHPGYQLEEGGSVPSILSPDDPPQARAAFTAHKLWVTAHDPAELWPAGDFPNQSKGGDGLPAFVADKQPLENKDLVLWYSLGFRHVTRPEDWPLLPTRWFEFRLRPYGFFNHEPSHGLAPHFSRKYKSGG